MFKYICKRDGHSIWTFLIDSDTDQTLEIHKDPDDGGIQVGDIYIGRVESIAAGINAAFIRIGSDQTAYLPLDALKNPFFTEKGSSKNMQQGDELIVQVQREAIKGKLPAVTAGLSLQGSFVSVETGAGVCVSKKIDRTRREQLRCLGKELLGGTEGISILFRTKAAEASDDIVSAEAIRLTAVLKKILDTARYKVCYSKLYAGPRRYVERLLHLPENELEKIVTDEEELAGMFRQQLSGRPGAPDEKVQLYKDPLLEMSVLYSLEHRKSRALNDRVPLKSGGTLVISPTEALTAIDVNTGKSTVSSGKHSKEETVLKINLEAAKEIAVQLRLRNISGIIIVDFINMTEQESERKLMERLSELLSEDPVKTVLIDMTRLGLVEITRKKIEKPLWEM